MLGLYLHIPFCSAICGYCNFNRGLLDEGQKARYVTALEREIRKAGDGSAVDSVFFGGGTPSLLTADEVGRVLDACRTSYAISADAEITLETNPETVTDAKLAAVLDAGVNRLSFGVQSFDDDELKRLGRIHSADRAAEALRSARRAGFSNVSLDLMLWLPGQSPASWQRTVERAVALGPDHLSLYLLELYPNAPLKEAMARAAGGGPGTSQRVGGSTGARAEWVQSSEEEAADMYLAGLAALDAAGYEQYEISNVSRPGRASRHNLKYWEGGEWRGFGCGAHSTMAGRRWKNVSSTEDYIGRLTSGTSVATEERDLPKEEQLGEALFTGLRLSAGIDRGNFLARFGVDPWSRYGLALQPCVDDDLMWVDGAKFGLTRRGMLVANEIMVLFV